ncbi:ATP-binding protein [Methylocucumis oryzae]|uniref:ATP-binding protein n=1 Tax=Methylocucumis oryzae TaxID=1632867 RepID=UPI000697DB77|nr:transporter substrate-binding domain-containing protein [Methylocucumis oryzae]
MLPPGEARRLHMAVRKDLPILASIVRKSLDAIPIADKIDLEDKWFERTPSKTSKPIYISKTEQKWLAEHPIIRFSGDPKWLPYEAFDNNGRYVGIVAEYLRLIEQKLRIHLEIVPTQSWTETVQKIKQGEIDVISETIDSDLNKQLTFTHAYLSSPVVIVMRDEEVYVDDIAQISAKRIGLVKEYGYNPAIIKQYPDIKFYEVESVQDGLTHVSTRKLDALICTLAQASYHISEQGVNNVRIVGKTQFATKLGYGMRPEFAPLVPLFNRALNTINPNDKQKILENWGKEQFIEKIDYSLIFKIIGGFLLLLVLTFLWNRRLVQEIQRRKLSEQKVLLLNKRLALATEVLALGVWELEFGEQLALIFDERSLAIYDLAPDAPLDFDVWLSVVHPDDRHLLKQLIFTIENNQTPTPIEFRLKNSASDIRTIYCAATAVREGDHIIKVTGVNWDISDRKKAELALATAKEQAEHANKAKSQFLANMSHEIRTPLNAIIGFTELLSEQIKEPKHLSFVQTIQSAGQNLLALINDILDLSKIEAGKLNIEKNVCNPHDLFNELNHIFSLKVREKNLQLQLDVDPKIPEHLILDAVRLRQVLFNLIGNAVKFTDTGYVRLSARTTNEDDIHSKLDLVIEVEDTGIGIDKSQQHIVFNDFEQSEGQDYRKYGGTGLGLAISSRLTEMMGGIISLSSQLGVGTTFTIHLFDVDVAVMSGEQQPEALPVPVGKINFHPGVVLVVDDVTNNRSLLRESFADTSLTILEAENGLIAVNMVKQNAIDLILMDIRMPVMDGYEAAALIKSISDIPIIALTASVMRDQYERLKSSNFEGYLRKPVLKADLHQELTKFLAFDTVTENATPEKQEATLQLTHDELALLPSVLDKLVELQSLCAQSLKNNNLTDAKNFADALSALSETSSIALVRDYANTLQEHIDCFDLLAIQQQLSNFPALVQALSEFKPALRG